VRPAVLLALALFSVGVDQPRESTGPRGSRAPAVSFEFLALYENGRPVPDLTPAEVRLKIGGRERPLGSLRLIQLSDPPSAAGSSGPSVSPEPLPPPFETNALTTGSRTILIVFEDESFRPGEEKRARDEIGRLLSGLAPRDRVALISMPYGGVEVNLTTDHARIRNALATLVGRSPRQQTSSEAACRSRRTINALIGLLDGLAGNGVPITVAFISTGLMGPTRDAPAESAPGQCDITPELFTDLGLAADAARVQFYVIQSDEAAFVPGASNATVNLENMRVGLEHLAGVVGARLLRFTGSAEGPLGIVARETSAYYLLLFEPEASERNGSSQRVEIRVARANVTVRARPSVVIPKPGSGRAPSPRDMLRDATILRNLPMRAAGLVSKNIEDDDLRIIVVFESLDATATIASAAAGLIDARGRLVKQWTAESADLARTPALAALVARPGRYRLRVAAVDAAGRAGTVDSDFEAGLTRAGPLQVSGSSWGCRKGGWSRGCSSVMSASLSRISNCSSCPATPPRRSPSSWRRRSTALRSRPSQARSRRPPPAIAAPPPLSFQSGRSPPATTPCARS
jgi:hypothetical protein